MGGGRTWRFDCFRISSIPLILTQVLRLHLHATESPKVPADSSYKKAIKINDKELKTSWPVDHFLFLRALFFLTSFGFLLFCEPFK